MAAATWMRCAAAAARGAAGTTFTVRDRLAQPPDQYPPVTHLTVNRVGDFIWIDVKRTASCTTWCGRSPAAHQTSPRPLPEDHVAAILHREDRREPADPPRLRALPDPGDVCLSPTREIEIVR